VQTAPHLRHLSGVLYGAPSYSLDADNSVFSGTVSHTLNRGYYHCCDWFAGRQEQSLLGSQRPFALTIPSFEVAGAAVGAVFAATVCRARMTADRVSDRNRSSMVIKVSNVEMFDFRPQG